MPDIHKSKETPAQKIKHLERELEDEKLKKSSAQPYGWYYGQRAWGWTAKKVLIRSIWEIKEETTRKLTSICRVFDRSPQGMYQAIKRIKTRAN